MLSLPQIMNNYRNSTKNVVVEECAVDGQTPVVLTTHSIDDDFQFNNFDIQSNRKFQGKFSLIFRFHFLFYFVFLVNPQRL